MYTMKYIKKIIQKSFKKIYSFPKYFIFNQILSYRYFGNEQIFFLIGCNKIFIFYFPVNIKYNFFFNSNFFSTCQVTLFFGMYMTKYLSNGNKI